MPQAELLTPDAWHTTIRQRALNLDKKLESKTMPSTEAELHALLDRLHFPKLEEAAASGKTMQIGLAIERERLVASWEEFSPEVRAQKAPPKKPPPSPPETPTTRVSPNPDSAPQHPPKRKTWKPKPKSEDSGHYDFHDSPHIPPRLYEGYGGYNGAYKDLNSDELALYIHGDERNGKPEEDPRTFNVHEYMVATRMLHQLTHKDVDKESGHGERGEHMPAWETQARFKKNFPEEAERFEELSISNTLDIIHAELELGHVRESNSHMRYLAPAYWQKALCVTNDPHAWAVSGDKPSWHEAIMPITTQGEYLRAARKALGIDIKEAAKMNALSTAAIHDAENGRDISPDTKLRILESYRDKELLLRERGEIKTDEPLFINPLVYEKKTVQTRLSKRSGAGVE